MPALKKFLVALVLASSSLAVGSASAVFELTPADQTTAPETDVFFSGMLTNTGGSDLYLNGDVAVLPFAGLVLDDSAFFADAPLFLPPGGTYSGPFFDVQVGDVASGLYDGSFTIQGGDTNAFDDLATQDFQVAVQPTPEPRYVGLIECALLTLFVRRLRTSRA